MPFKATKKKQAGLPSSEDEIPDDFVLEPVRSVEAGVGLIGF